MRYNVNMQPAVSVERRPYPNEKTPPVRLKLVRIINKHSSGINGRIIYYDHCESPTTEMIKDDKLKHKHVERDVCTA